MIVALKDNAFKATQWFKDGDHPAVKHHRASKVRSTDAYDEIDTVYDYDDMSSRVNPGDWIVEMFDGLHLYTDAEYKELFNAAPEAAGRLYCKTCYGGCKPPYACGSEEYCAGDTDKMFQFTSEDRCK